MVMPRSRSMSMESSTCSLPAISRSERPPVIWIRRSASVDLPWSIWATIERLRMFEMGAVVMGAGYHSRPRAATILLYFQGLCSRQADSTAAQNALRNAHVDHFDTIRKNPHEDALGLQPFSGLAGCLRDPPRSPPLAGDPASILHAVLWTLILINLKA